MVKKDEYYDNPYYKKFLVEKNKIKEKYPKELFETATSRKDPIYSEESKLIWRQYLKELGNLMFKPKGLYQDFIWDIISESEKIYMETKARNGKQGRKTT